MDLSSGISLIGFGLALVMGLVLGLLGGGGSILTVPILVYFFDIPATLATGYSLFIVGSTSIFGVISYIRCRLVDFKVALIFAIPSLVGVTFSRKVLIPNLPHIISLGPFTTTKDHFILVVFGLLVLVISLFMMRSKEPADACETTPATLQLGALFLLMCEGLIVGCLTGFVGAGGGFMIVPALVMLTNISLRGSIATSLFVISLNSLWGFAGDLSEGVVVDWLFLLTFLSLALIGVAAGVSLNQKIPVAKLRKGFGIFVMVMGLFILGKELF